MTGEPRSLRSLQRRVLEQRRRVAGRLALGFGATFGLVVIGGLLAYLSLRSVNAASREEIAALSGEFGIVHEVATSVLREVASGTRYLNTGSAADERRYYDDMAAADRVRREAIGRATLSPDERRALELIGQHQAAIEVGIQTSHAYAESGRMGDAVRVLEATATEIDALQRALDAARQSAVARAERRSDRLAERAHLMEILLLAVIGIAAVSAVASATQTTTAVTQPLAIFAREMEAMGAGDLRVHPGSRQHRATTVEYEHLGTSLDQARARLRMLLERVQAEAERVSAASAELEATATGASESTQHVTAAVTDMAAGAAAQLDALTQATDAVARLAEEGASIAEAAIASQEAGQEIRYTAGLTREEISRAIATLLDAREVVDSSAREITALQEATARIDKFVSLISDIASQTNLLALNAAIEAARAGDAGRGFAVVAEEVRALADQSHHAAGEVTETVRRIRDRVGSATAAVGDGSDRMKDVEEVAAKASEAIAKIGEAVGRVERAAERVARAVEENQATLAQVQQAISTARDAAQGHAATSEEVAASAEQTSASVQEVSATASELLSAAKRVYGVVSEFKT